MTNAQYSPQPGLGPGHQPPSHRQQSKGLGISSMVLGIIAVVLAFIPVIGAVSFVLGLAAIGLGIFAIIKHKGKGQGIAGIITGAVSLVVALIVTLMTGAVVSAVDQGLQDAEEEFQAGMEEGAENSNQDETGSEGAEEAENAGTPQAYSAVTVVGDEDALPQGEDGEVSVVAISEPESNTSFGFIVHNGTDETISRVEVSGRAVDPDGETLGTGASHSVDPNVVLPGGYAFGYVYVDSSEHSLPEGATIPDLRIDFTDGLGSFENIISLDIENFEELSNGDFTGDVTNPHDGAVSGPISVNTVCFSEDEQVTYNSSFADNDSVDSGESTTWTLSTYSENPECAVRLFNASGFDS